MVGGMVVLARNELLAIVHAVDVILDDIYSVPEALRPLYPTIRKQMMSEINRIDVEGDW
jgi:hypothetical protein